MHMIPPLFLTVNNRIVQILSVIFTLFTTQTSFASPDVTKIINNTASGIVTVQAIQWITVKIPEQYKEIEKDPVYQAFSRILNEEGSQVTTSRAPVIKKKKQATGFIISPKGLIITNYQTVIDAHEIYVQLADKRSFKATFLQSEPKRDLAIIKVDANSLPALKLATEAVEGEWVLAIGANKSGSSLGTILSIPSRENQALMTNIEISKMNTGGPLLNGQGEVIAMNSNLLNTPAGMTRHALVSDLLKQEKLQTNIPQSWQKLGFTAKNITQIQQKKLGLINTVGAWVASVKNNSIAEKSGLQQDDIIVALESQQVIEASNLSALHDFLEENNSVDVTVFRAGESRTLRFSTQKPSSTSDDENIYSWEKLGLKVKAINNAQKDMLSVDEGVQIIAVNKGASNTGLQIGDFILNINQQVLKNAEQLNNIAKNLKSGSIIIAYIAQKDLRQFVEIVVE